MGAFYSKFRGPILTALVFVLLHTVFVLVVTLMVVFQQDVMWWILPYGADYPSSLVLGSVDNLPFGTFLTATAFLLIGLPHWSIIGFVIGCTFRWFGGVLERYSDA